MATDLTKAQVMTGEDIPSPCGCENSWMLRWSDRPKPEGERDS